MSRMTFACRLAALWLLAAGPVLAESAAPTMPPRGAPSFTIEDMVNARSIGQVVLSPDRRWFVHTYVGRYFGHPLLPAFGEDSNLVLRDLEGTKQIKLTTGDNQKSYPAFSPDGRRIAYESEGDIWTVGVADGAARRLTTNVGQDKSAIWSPDGRQIAFVSSRWGRPGLYVMSADGERKGLKRITPVGINPAFPAWSPDGRYILFTAATDAHFYSRGMYRVSADGGEPERITPTDDAKNAWPSFSPDGKMVAYISDRSGYLNVWLMSPDGKNQRQLTKVAEDQDYPDNDYIQTMGLKWSPNGRRISYFTNQHGNLRLMSVDVASGHTTVVDGRDGANHPVGWVDDNSVAFVHESYREPPEINVKTIGGANR